MGCYIVHRASSFSVPRNNDYLGSVAVPWHLGHLYPPPGCGFDVFLHPLQDIYNQVLLSAMCVTVTVHL